MLARIEMLDLHLGIKQLNYLSLNLKVKSKFPSNLMHVLPISNLICIILGVKQFLPLAISEESFNCRATNGHYPYLSELDKSK